ncbi:MAG: hypothetical protein E7055_13170 [Lentisphaerae bacterium]|nr:hypothetical protein [Lentisphaerota bacterium]
MKIKNFLIYLYVYMILISTFICLLILSAALPHTRKFDSLMRRSARILAKGGDYPETSGVTLDNCSDSLILNIAYSFDSKQPIRSAIEAVFYAEKGKEFTHTLNNMVNSKRNSLVKGSYARYWFGHSAVIKILHYVWHLDKIYVLYGSLILFLLFISVVHAYKTAGFPGLFALYIVLSLCNFQVFFMSLQFTPVIFIGLGGLIWVCRQRDISRRNVTFYILGMLTAFLDLLTAPILAFGIPALFICGKDFLQAESANGRNWKNWFRIWFGYPAAWLAGYVMSWGTKILLGICLSGNVQQVFHQIFLRISTSGKSIEFTRWQSIVKNFQFLYDNSQLILLLTGIIIVPFLMVKIYQWKKHKLVFNSRLFLGYLMLAAMPIAVIFLMANHTYIHDWMTYRGLALTCAALFMSLTAFQPEKRWIHEENRCSAAML